MHAIDRSETRREMVCMDILSGIFVICTIAQAFTIILAVLSYLLAPIYIVMAPAIFMMISCFVGLLWVRIGDALDRKGERNEKLGTH